MLTCPAHLVAAYEWTAAAGELDLLLALARRQSMDDMVALADYCHNSAANAYQHGVLDVHATDIGDLGEWLCTLSSDDSAFVCALPVTRSRITTR